MASNKEIEFIKTEFIARGQENWRSDKRGEFVEYARDEDLTLPSEEDWNSEADQRYLRRLDILLGDKDFMDGLFEAGRRVQIRRGVETGQIIEGKAHEVVPPKLITDSRADSTDGKSE